MQGLQSTLSCRAAAVETTAACFWLESSDTRDTISVTAATYQTGKHLT